MNDRDVDQIVRSALAAGAADAGSHPEPDTLFHYYADELGAADADSVQAHLALCPACARAVLDFETFPHLDAPSDDDVPSAEEIEAGWADVEARLGRASRPASPAGAARGGETEAPDAAAPDAPARAHGAVVVSLTPRTGAAPRPAAPARGQPARLAAAAAILAATTLGLGYFLGTRAGLLANVSNLSLQPEDALARGETGPQFQLTTIPRGVPAVRIALVTGNDLGPGPYVAEVRAGDPAERVVERVPGLVPDVHGELGFFARRGWLREGRYHIVLVDPQGAAVAEYRLQLQVE